FAVYFWRDAVAQAEAADTARAGEAAKAKEAADNAANAERSAREAAASAKELEAKVAEFDQLAGVLRLQRLQEGLDELAAPWRDLTAAQGWLAEADRVLTLRPALEKTVADLRQRALPVTPEDLARDRATHPRREEYDALRARLVDAERAAAMQGGEVLALPSLTPEEEALAPDELSSLAWCLLLSPFLYPEVYLDLPAVMPRAVALAKHALAKSEAAGTKHANLADTLAWAWFWNGRDTEALRQSEAALALAPETRRAEFEANIADLRRRIAAGEGKALVRRLEDTVTRLRAETGSLERVLGERRTYRFEAEAQGFLHDTLTELLAKLAAFEKTERTDVATRLRCAELTATHPKARATWQQAREAIEKADGLVASTLYRGHPIKLRPHLGLVPIGMNPVTKLWEFYELRSAWDPGAIPDPAALEIPRHDADGRIAVGADTGIVFALLPGGTFTMGAQKRSKDKPNYDPDAQGIEIVHPETLAPFFLARHELTQGQWRRLGGKRDQNLSKRGDTYPIADVDWFTSNAPLRAAGLSLPTEAQWEYGCRATSTTPWWTGADAASLR
ncbi:MAG: SUMF1/EgtB/PvdO family nonheme iron enzyme, partial [Candidatus Methylomirabilis sp.]|nr:SUMF1/EgtB/PvdO family nonheme iron enzyme [Deltaproteobacteria bacterium]